MNLLFGYLIFPGFLFSASIGLLAGWLDRKISARLQWRVGPPWYQNFMDIFKLMGKESILPKGAKNTFILSPYIGLFSLVIAAFILGKNIIQPQESFIGDLIVVLYLLTMPAVALILGASSSRNPLASLGASREMKLILGYELPFLLSVIAVIIKSAGAIKIGLILEHQMIYSSNIASLSGVLAFLVALICMHAKLGYVPFDVSEADQEIMGGVLIEYSGMPLAVFKLTKAVLLYTAPVFLITLFLGNDTSALIMALKFLAILIVFVLIKNTNPRLRIDQILRFFWGPVTAVALIAVILAAIGL